MNNYRKTRELQKELRKLELEHLFTVDSVGSADVFRCEYSGKGVNMVLLMVVEEGDWIMLRYLIAENNNPVKQERLYELLNLLNSKRKIKYYIGDDNLVVGEFFLRDDEYSFDANACIQMAIGYLKSIEQEDYSRIMRVLWS